MALAAVGKTQHSLTGPVKYVIFFNSYVTIDLQIINSLQDYSIFTSDNEFKINTWSSGSETIFGYETEEVIGKPFEIIFTEEDINIGIPKKEIDTALKEGRATDNRWHIVKDGSLFFAYGVVFPLIGSDGDKLGYVKILRDLTKRKQSEEAINKYIRDLEDLNAHKENVLAILSHDLRSPLATIIQTSEYLKENFQTMEPDEVQEMLDGLHKSSVGELEMLDYLVEWARIKYASDVFADDKMLISIIQNIVSNAIKHTGKGGTIKVSAKTKDDKIIIQVKDTGAGMSKEIMDNLFTPQMQSLSEERKEKPGAGIGLLLVKGFLEKSGGGIWVESIVGEGSSFYFTLPIDKPLDIKGSSGGIEFDEGA